MMKITYLDHSGFALEYKDYVLIFDYYKGQVPVFDRNKKIIVFASHVHADHFQRSIFDWARQYQDITYILSDDIPYQRMIRKREDLRSSQIISVGADMEMDVSGIQIRTLRSTDEGVAFLICLGDKVIYHAGDLNWWHWDEEDDKTWNIPMKEAYQAEIAKLRDIHIDVAFVPLDARQKYAYYWGLDYFMKHTDTKVVFPMHMQDYDVCRQLREEPEAASYIDRVVFIEQAGQVFIVEE